ncbi:hypothetical protein [Providencia rustigianii]
MKLCRNHIKRIGLNINMILLRDEGRVLDKENAPRYESVNRTA